jgi:hypothetical protein
MYRDMRFKEWLFAESADQVVLMKTVNDEGPQTLRSQGDKAAPKVDPWSHLPQPEGQVLSGKKKWNKILDKWIDAPDAQAAHPPIQRRNWIPPPGTEDLSLEDLPLD